MDTMVTPIKIHIRVPATSANLGPAFDLMGIALNLYNHFYFEISPNKRNFYSCFLDGTALPFAAKDDLVNASYRYYFDIFLNGETAPGYQVKMELNLPLKGGLGSSATAVIAGFCLARELHKKWFSHIPLPDEKTFMLHLALLEGHPDNTIPAYMGNLVFSFLSEEQTELFFFRKPFPAGVSLYIMIPEIEISTNDSRRKLPQTYFTRDIIFNMSRIACWFEFLSSGDFGKLTLAVEDKIHTPYRAGNFPFLQELANFLYENGACYTISGSGPTLLIFAPQQQSFFNELKHYVSEVIEQFQMNIHLKEVAVDAQGIQLEVEDS